LSKAFDDGFHGRAYLNIAHPDELAGELRTVVRT